MHAGVFGARISEETFQTLLDLMQSNFAALNIPDENQVEKNNNVVIFSAKVRSRNSTIIFRDSINLKLSKLIKNPPSQEIRGVFEIVLPIIRNPYCYWPDPNRIMMNGGKFLEDSHEPMEIEDVSSNESIGGESKSGSEFKQPFIKKEKDSEDSESSEVNLKPRKILRESKLTRVLDGKNTPEVDDKKTAGKNWEEITELQNAKSEISESTETQKITKSRLRPLVKKDETRITESGGSSFYYFWQMLFFILFPIAVLVVCVFIAREEFGSEICAHKFDTTSAIKDLENRVFGQSRAIRELKIHLTVNSSGIKLLGIIGGTGVGKSYAAHIISENFPVKKNVFQYGPPLKSRRRFASGAISVCGCNLVILENLHNKDISDAVDFVEYLTGKVDNENYCVFIINVINVQEIDENLKRVINLDKSKSEIENSYGKKNLDIKIVQFDNLDDEAIKKCIIDDARNRNLTLSENEIDDVRISLKISDSGCKGARAKVQLLDKKLDLLM